MSETAPEARSKSVARFNGPGRRQPKMAIDAPRGDASGTVKPRIARQGYILFLTMSDLDCLSGAAARCLELARELEVDLGGADRLSTAQRQLIQRAAVLAAQLEDFETRWCLGEVVELPDYLQAINVQRRLLATLGLERRPRDVSPDVRTYLRDAAARHEASEAAGR